MLLLVFCLGAAGGIWAQAFLLPYAATQPPFADWQFIKEWNSKTTVLREIREIVVNRDEAIERAIEKAQKLVVGVRSAKGKQVREGSGFIATSDGFIITLASLVPQGYTVMVYIDGEKEPVLGQVLKRDAKTGLALLKIEKNNLQTTGFADENSVKLGMPVFLVGRVFGKEGTVSLVNQGIVKGLSKDAISTNMVEELTLQGSALFDIAGRIVGLNTVDKEGKVVSIPSALLLLFAGF